MHRSRSKLTYANVMVTILAFVVLFGGASYAASQLGKNSVGSKQLKKESITGAKIKKDAVTGDKVKDGSLSGADINLGTLGSVPSATKATSAVTAGSAGSAAVADNASALQGKTASAFVQGTNATVLSARRQLTAPVSNVALFDIPGIGSLKANCTGGPTGTFALTNTSGGTLDRIFQANSSTIPSLSTVANGATSEFGDSVNEGWTMRFATQTATPIVVTIDAVLAIGGGNCTMIAQAVASS